MILIEGPDNAGKTTLVEQLLALDPALRVLHRDRFKPGQQETIGTSYINALLPKDGDRVVHSHGLMDRVFASEEIYGDLFRDGSRLSDGERLAVRNVFNSYGAIAVHVDAPDATIMATWKKRGQLYDDPLVIARAYRERFKTIFCTSDHVRYDWTRPGAAAEREDLVIMHQRAQLRMRRELTWWSAVPYGIGKLSFPRVVLIGESPSPQARTSAPFANGPAGDFLAWTIEQAAERVWMLRHELYVTNAVKGTDRDAAILREELSFLIGQKTAVVALGVEADQLYQHVSQTLPRQPLAYTALPHPQFWRRFKYPERGQYVKQFIRAVAPALRRP